MILLVAASAFRRSRCPCRSSGSRSSGRGLLAGNLALAGRRQLRYALDLAAPLLYLLLEQKGGLGNAFPVWLRLAGGAGGRPRGNRTRAAKRWSIPGLPRQMCAQVFHYSDGAATYQH